jgi:tRNA-dihydrouridine synthase B
VPVPVTLKIRTGWDATHKNAPEIARIAQDRRHRGAGDPWPHPRPAIHRHGRVRHHRRGQGGTVDPGVRQRRHRLSEQARAVLRHTGCDAVLVGRAAQGRPWIFREIAHFLATGERCAPPSLPKWRYPARAP